MNTQNLLKERGLEKLLFNDLSFDYMTSENELAKIIYNSPTPIAVFDDNMNYIIVNPAWLEDYDISHEDIIGKSHYDIFPNIPLRWKDIHQRCLQGEMVTSDEDFFLNADKKNYVKYVIRPWYRGDEVGGIVMQTELITDFVKSSNSYEMIKGQLRRKVLYDDLSGFFNNDTFFRRINDHLKESGNENYAIVAIHMRNYSDIVNEYDYVFAKKLTKTLSKTIANSVLEVSSFNDDLLITRVNGADFALYASESELDEVLEKLKEISNSTYEVDGQSVRVEGSCGVALNEKEIDTPSLYYRAIDASLEVFEGVMYYSKEFHNQRNRKVFIRKNLEKAMGNDELFMLYQPQIDSQTGNLVGLESLVRWQSPEIGMVSPGEFVPAIEKGKLIESLGRYTIGRVCRDISVFTEKLPRVSVNVSANEINNLYLKNLKFITDSYGIGTDRLKLEITEREAVGSVKVVDKFINDLKKLDMKISMDDFGVEHSSLGMLARFDFDEIKLDREFILSLGKNPDKSLQLLSGLSNVADSLGINVVAEGVESREEIELLNKCGIHLIQGYYYSRPDTLENILKKFKY